MDARPNGDDAAVVGAALPLLHAAPIAWLSTVRPDGRPHVVPTWFSWDGTSFLLFSKPGAVKVRNIRRVPHVMLAIGDPLADFDVQLIEGEAVLLDAPAAEVMPAGHLGRYRAWLEAIGLDRDEYVATYSQAIRIRPTRFLPWRGRSRGARHSDQSIGRGRHTSSPSRRRSSPAASHPTRRVSTGRAAPGRVRGHRRTGRPRPRSGRAPS